VGDTPALLSDETTFCGPSDKISGRMNIQLSHQIRSVIIDRLRTDEQNVGDCLIRVTFSNQL
jgi:hypothetical protein